jgi:hypothetical protein
MNGLVGLSPCWSRQYRRLSWADPLAPRLREVVRHVAPEAPRVVRAPLIEVQDRVVGDPEVQPPVFVAHGSLRFDDIDPRKGAQRLVPGR